MRIHGDPIDWDKYDIRVLWTGVNEQHVSADLGLVEGYPIDPPDDLPGWILCGIETHVVKVRIKVEGEKKETEVERERYCVLWKRLKASKAKKKAGRKKSGASASTKSEEPAAPKTPKQKRTRKRRNGSSPNMPEPPSVSTVVQNENSEPGVTAS